MTALYTNTLTCTFSELSEKLIDLSSNTSITISDPAHVILGDSNTSGTLGFIIRNYTGNCLLDFSPSDFSTSQCTSGENLFANCASIVRMCRLPSSITSTSYMFSNCVNLLTIDTSSFINVTDSNHMFVNCLKLVSIDTSTFKNVLDISGMFYGCSRLAYVNTSSFANCTNATYAFYYCSKLTKVDTSSFSKVTNASYMFANCTKLIIVDKFGLLSNVCTVYTYMFLNCILLYRVTFTSSDEYSAWSSKLIAENGASLTSEQVSNSSKWSKFPSLIVRDCWSRALFTKHVETTWTTLSNDLSSMTENTSFFLNDPENVLLGDSDTEGTLGYKIKTYNNDFLIDLLPCDFSDTTYTEDIKSTLFTGCTKLVGMCALPENIVDARYMFDNCSQLVSIDTYCFTNVENSMGMFRGCIRLRSIDTTPFIKVKIARLMFQGCAALTSIDTSVFSSIVDSSNMFAGCSGIKSIETCFFSGVVDACGMFNGCTGLTSIDTYAFSMVENASYMFADCTSLLTIDTVVFTKVVNALGMFHNCFSLVIVNIDAFTNVINASYMFENCYQLKEIDASTFLSIMHASYMFAGCAGLIGINTVAFLNITTADNMFSGCRALTAIDISPFNNATNVDSMLYGCTELATVYIGNNVLSLVAEPKVNNNFMGLTPDTVTINVGTQAYDTWYFRLYVNYALWGLSGPRLPKVFVVLHDGQTYDINISGNAATSNKSIYALTAGETNLANVANKLSNSLTITNCDKTYVYDGSSVVNAVITTGEGRKLSLINSNEYSDSSIGTITYTGAKEVSNTVYRPDQDLNTTASPLFRNITIGNDASIVGNLSVTGNSTINGTETVNNFKDNGNATITSNLSVGGATIVNTLSTISDLLIGGSSTLNGPLTVNNTENVTGQLTSGRITSNGAVIINPINVSNNFDEGLRICRANSGFSTLTIGAEGDTGITDGAWWIGTNIKNYGRRLYISSNQSTDGNCYFFADSNTSGTSGLNISRIQCDTITAYNNVTIGGSLSITGNSTTSGTETVNNFVDNGNATISGNTTIGGTLSVTGTITGTLSGQSSAAKSLVGADGNYYHVSTGTDCITAGMTADSIENSAATWAHYLFFNHGNGATYYNFTLRLPFYDQQVPQYQRRTDGTLRGWHNFITDENSDATIEAKLLKGATISNLTITGTTTSSSSATFAGPISASYFTATSSRKVKTNIKAFKGSALNILDNTKIVSFNYKADENKSFKIGFIAEDTHPYLSGEKKEQFDIDNSIGLLIKSVQELNKKIEKLQREKNVNKSNKQ